MNLDRAFRLFYRRMLCLEPAKICPIPGLRLWLYRRMGVRIGRDVFIGFHVDLDSNHPELIEIGDHVTITARCMLVTHMATSVQTPLLQLYPGHAAPIRICDGAYLCASAIVVPGVTVGENALVAAGSVVTRDVPPATLVAGVPARPVKTLDLKDPGG